MAYWQVGVFYVMNVVSPYRITTNYMKVLYSSALQSLDCNFEDPNFSYQLNVKSTYYVESIKRNLIFRYARERKSPASNLAILSSLKKQNNAYFPIIIICKIQCDVNYRYSFLAISTI